MQPTALIAKILQDIRASYWFVPGLLVLIAVVLSSVTQHLDHLGLSRLLPVSLRDTQVEGARAVLSVIAQSVIGVAGVMFSLTVVAVSFASSNFGPRLIGNFMRDRANQVSLGILIATFVYTMLILRGVQDPSAEDADLVVEVFVPHLSISTAIVLAMISVVTMIYFIHHIPEAINIANITASLGSRLEAAIREGGARREDATEPMPEGLPVHHVEAGASGYMRTLNAARLQRLAEDQGWWVDVLKMPGDFVDSAQYVLRLHGGTLPDADLTEQVRSCYALGTERTESQNMMFIVEQLCEVVARALSPGVNDPFTAINCMNWLHVGLRLALRTPPGWAGSAHSRLRMPVVTFTDLLGVSHRLTRPYVAADVTAARHVLGLLDELLRRTPEGPRRDAVQAEREALETMALDLHPDPVARAMIADR